MIDLYLQNGHHIDLVIFTSTSFGHFLFNFRESSPTGKLDWDIDIRRPYDGLSDTMCLFGDDPVVLRKT